MSVRTDYSNFRWLDRGEVTVDLVDILQNHVDFFEIRVRIFLTDLRSFDIDEDDRKSLDKRIFRVDAESYLVWQCGPV